MRESLYPFRYRTAFAFSAFLYPLPLRRALRLPTVYAEDNGLTVFLVSNNCGLGPLFLPVALCVHEGGEEKPPARYSAFWLRLLSIFSLFIVTTSTRAFTCVDHTAYPSSRSALMLADHVAASRLRRQPYG